MHLPRLIDKMSINCSLKTSAIDYCAGVNYLRVYLSSISGKWQKYVAIFTEQSVYVMRTLLYLSN